MRWRDGRRSSNIEDRRGQRPRRGLKIGGIGLVLAVLAMLVTGDPSKLLQQLFSGGGGGGSTGDEPYEAGVEEQELADFISVVLADTEDTWGPLFESTNRTYQEPTLVMFREAVQSACGHASSAVGPFYCPGDHQVYIDLEFFSELGQRFGAPGDFAQAYVVAHEVGHHVQALLGTSERIQRQRQQVSETEANALSVKLELQADCYAGVWAHHANEARDILESGDVEEALNAATAIGDDTLQRNAGRNVTPESFTHGSADQRVRWFRRGLRHGSLDRCDTFSSNSL